MIQLLLALSVLLTIVWFFGAYKRGTPAVRRRLVAGFFFVVLLGAVLFLTVTGRLHFIAAIVTALLPFVKKLLPFLRYVPVLRRFVKLKKNDAQTEAETEGQKAAGAAPMTKSQALDVLGLKSGASEEEIISAHRALMQKVHPDRGGSDYLAAQLNQAKDTLLS